MRASGKGLALFLCKGHVQHLQRHGSAWHGTYGAAERRPYEAAAKLWIEQHRTNAVVAHALARLDTLLATAGKVVPATNLRGMRPAERAKVALARLRDAGVKPERLLAIHLGISALIKEDPMAPGDRGFRMVQVAKVAHRLASGFHQTWDFPMPNGAIVPYTLHKYPRSAGRVLRYLGAMIERCCEHVADDHLSDILALKIERFGKHPAVINPLNAPDTIAGRLFRERLPKGYPHA